MTLKKQLEKRATVRQYSQEPVEDFLLNSLLEAAGHTQTMGNLQLYSVVVTRDASMKERLAPAHFNQPMVTQAPVVLTICADFYRTSYWCQCRKAIPGYGNLLSFVNAASDALLYTQTFCNLAEEAGLGVCYIGATIYQPELIIDVLQLPHLVMPIATLTVGWPAQPIVPSDRLPLASYVHAETYRNYTPEDIDLYYNVKEALPENQHFVEINQKETLAQIFTDIRYTKKDNEIMSEGFAKALRRQGLLS